MFVFLLIFWQFLCNSMIKLDREFIIIIFMNKTLNFLFYFYFMKSYLLYIKAYELNLLLNHNLFMLQNPLVQLL